MPRTIKLTLAYDGTHYAGWQFQRNQPSLQESLERVLARITGESIRVTASGRTDAGVHALGQVVSFRTECPLPVGKLHSALNAWLPKDMLALSVQDAPDGFHAIRAARRKRYRYVLHDGPRPDIFRRHYCWHYYGRLDAEAMHRAAQPLAGRHDFRSFQSLGSVRTSTVRTVWAISVERGRGGEADFIHVEVEADGFLYNMVRAIVGTLLEVGRGVRDETWPQQALAARDRTAAGPTAPAQGLFLLRVEYDD